LALDFGLLHKLKVLEVSRDNLLSSSYVKMYSKSSEAENPRPFQPQTRSGALFGSFSYATRLELQRMEIGRLGQ
jgi:hypothetical protein